MMHLLFISIFQGWLHRTRTTSGLLMLCLLWPGLTDSKSMLHSPVRLVDGNLPSEGRVEIFYDGQWGTICDDDWDIDDAHVVCRALGFESAIEARGNAAYGEGSGPIVLDDVHCNGTETHLAECSSSNWLTHNCGHGEDAGVVCKIEFKPRKFLLDHSGGFPEDFGKLYDSRQGCDLNITVLVAEKTMEPLRLCAHRLILHTHHEARALLPESGNSSTLQVEEECLPFVSSFVRYFYSRQIEISMNSVKCFHKLAVAYGIASLQAYCNQIFLSIFPLDPSFHVHLELYDYSLTSGDAQLQEVILQYLAWNCEALTRTEAWLALSSEKMKALLSRTDVVIESEWSLLKALYHWAQSNVTTRGLWEKIRFPMLLPEQLFELRFTLALHKDGENKYQRNIMDALDFHTVPLKFLRQYKLHDLSSDSYVPRFYTGSAWSRYLVYNPSLQWFISDHLDGSKLFPPFETSKHPSSLFKTQNISWSFSYQVLPTNSQTDSSSSSDISLVLHLALPDSSDDAIQYENKALLLCQNFYIIGVVDFKNGKAVVPSVASSACPNGYFSFVAVVRPVYKLNT